MATIEIGREVCDRPLEANQNFDPTVDPLELAFQATANLREHDGQAHKVEPRVVDDTLARIHQDAQHHKLAAAAQQGDMAALEKIWIEALDLADCVVRKSNSDWEDDDKMQTCLEEVPGAVQRYNPACGASFKTYLMARMTFALKDVERDYGRANGLGRGDHKKIEEALESEDPKASLHALTQPQESADGKSRAGFIMAPNLVLDSDIISRQPSLDELIAEGYRTDHWEPAGNRNVLAEAALNMDAEKAQRLVLLLRESQRIVAVLYYGLFGERPHTLDEIAEKRKVTRSRISQLKTAGEQKLAELWVAA